MLYDVSVIKQLITKEKKETLRSSLVYGNQRYQPIWSSHLCFSPFFVIIRGDMFSVLKQIFALRLIIKSNNQNTGIWEFVTKIYFSYLSTKTNVVGTQKNRLKETFLSTQNIC